MTLIVDSDQSKPAPRPVTFMLTCDGTAALFGCVPLSVTGHYQEFRTAAREAGWKFSQPGKHYCPSHKALAAPPAVDSA